MNFERRGLVFLVFAVFSIFLMLSFVVAVTVPAENTVPSSGDTSSPPSSTPATTTPAAGTSAGSGSSLWGKIKGIFSSGGTADQQLQKLQQENAQLRAQNTALKEGPLRMAFDIIYSYGKYLIIGFLLLVFANKLIDLFATWLTNKKATGFANFIIYINKLGKGSLKGWVARYLMCILFVVLVFNLPIISSIFSAFGWLVWKLVLLFDNIFGLYDPSAGFSFSGIFKVLIGTIVAVLLISLAIYLLFYFPISYLKSKGLTVTKAKAYLAGKFVREASEAEASLHEGEGI